MIVYRYMTEDEMLNIVNGKMKNVGAVFCNERMEKTVSNNHRYKNGVRYLHFFWKLQNIKFIQPLQKSNKSNMFICKFDIPFHILLRYMGEGYYEPSGYDIPYETIIEFAIPVDKIKPEFLRACAFDKNRDITPEQANCYFEKFEEKMNEHAREKTKGE